MANLQELDESIAWAEAHPEEHSQDHWFIKTQCGTTACIAGITTLRHGWIPVFPLLDGGLRTNFVSNGTEQRDVAVLAASILELTEEQRYALFIGATTLEDVKIVAKLIASGDEGALIGHGWLDGMYPEYDDYDDRED